MQKSDISVRDLVNKVQNDELQLPEMQRKYVWTATRVRDLLDSLYRNYPSGSILVWQTSENVVTHGLSVDATKPNLPLSRWLLLDGQQRITSLAAILTGQPIIVRNRKRPIEILFNLEHPEGPPIEVLEVDEEAETADIDEQMENDGDDRDIQEELKKRTFVVTSRALKNIPTWVSVSDIFNKNHAEILKRAGVTSFEDPNYLRYSDRLQKVKDIEKYMYDIQLLESEMSYEEVTEIFVRVNSLGVKLRGSDLALAQITAKWRGFMNLMDDFAETFGDDSDYVFDWLLVRFMTVFATKQSKFKTIGRYSKEKLAEAWDIAQNSLRFAVNFLRKNAGIDNLEYLSSPMLVVPIAVFAYLHNEQLSMDEEKKLLRWFFLAHIRGHYGMGSSESILDADLAVLFRGGTLDDLIAKLKEHVRRFELEPGELAGKTTVSPIFTMLYFVLKANGAKDWLTGLQLSDKTLGDTHKIQWHHIFPKAQLTKRNIDSKDINEIANLAFIGGKTNRHILDREPIDYFTNEIIPKRGETALTSQLIPADKRLWEMDNFQEFLAYRRSAIEQKINDFLGKLS
ncbi:DUF262 domain-containing protein [Patescibacteria group bacterium]|nr:DUF262 domain-containing protein [Patescibacteria group bacterium]